LKKTYIIALIIAVVLGGWLYSGVFNADSSADEVVVDEIRSEQMTPRVRVASSQAQPYTAQVIANGRTQAKRTVQVRSETSGRVIELPREKGATVEVNDLLCKLSLEDSEIQLDKAKAALRHAILEHKGLSQLNQSGYQGEVSMANVDVTLANARAELKRRELDVQYRNIRSPFKGLVQDRPVNIGDVLQPGSICAEILDPDPLLIVAHISEGQIYSIGEGAAATAKLKSGETVNGVVTYTSHAADPITSTYRVEIEIANTDFALRQGLSADVYLPLYAVPAHRVSPAALSLSDQGKVGIKIVNSDNQVEFVEVTIISDTIDGVWLTGLPAQVQIIVLGQENVFHSQTVEPVAVSAKVVGDISRKDSRADRG
jgi:multidrug efflux system membrane fusion protein